MFLDPWLVPFGKSIYVLPDNGPQFVSDSFATIHGYLRVKHLKMTVNYPQTNRQVERHTKTIVTRLRYYITYHQRNWDIFSERPTHAYNTQLYRSTNTPPNSLVLSSLPPGPSLLSRFRQSPSPTVGNLAKKVHHASRPHF